MPCPARHSEKLHNIIDLPSVVIREPLLKVRTNFPLICKVIAGRLYEGLTKAGYSAFLDTEAKFNLHDLATIVQYTSRFVVLHNCSGVFILILSAGIFDSPWCLQEIRSAVANSKPVRSA